MSSPSPATSWSLQVASPKGSQSPADLTLPTTPLGCGCTTGAKLPARGVLARLASARALQAGTFTRAVVVLRGNGGWRSGLQVPPVHEPSCKSPAEVLGIHIEYRDRQIFDQAVSSAVPLSGRLIPALKLTWKERGAQEYRPDKFKDHTYGILWTGRTTRKLAFLTSQGPIVNSWGSCGAAEET